jgi:hypothetical protein
MTSLAWRIALSLGGLVLVTVLVLSRGIGEPPSASGNGYVTGVAIGLSPRMTADGASLVAIQAIGDMRSAAAAAGQRTTTTTIRSVLCVRRVDIGSLEPRAAGAQPKGDPNAAFWIVRAEGTFVTQRGRSITPLVGTSGYFIIDDTSGEIVAWGMP